MIRFISALTVLAAVGIALTGLHQRATTAYACTVTAGYDPVAGSELVIDGVVTGFEPAADPSEASVLTIRVHRALKGEYAGQQLQAEFFTGPCVTLTRAQVDARQIVIALRPSADAETWTSGFDDAWFVDSPIDPSSHRRSLRDLYEGRRLDLLPPNVGSGRGDSADPGPADLVLLGAASLVVTGVAMSLTARRRRLSR